MEGESSQQTPASGADDTEMELNFVIGPFAGGTIDSQGDFLSSPPILPVAGMEPVILRQEFSILNVPLSDGASSEFSPHLSPRRYPSDQPSTWALLPQPERREVAQDLCVLDPQKAQSVLDRYPIGKLEGWCQIVDLKPTKDEGYAQVSKWGANKFSVLGHVVLWADGKDLEIDGECSHLCHRPLCKTVGHVTVESSADNNARKGCLVWIHCPHCEDKVILICGHDPVCIKYHPSYTSMRKLIEVGVCARGML